MNKKIALEARIAKVEKRFNNVALSSQVYRFHVNFRNRTNSSSLKDYKFGALRQMVVVISTCTK